MAANRAFDRVANMQSKSQLKPVRARRCSQLPLKMSKSARRSAFNVESNQNIESSSQRVVRRCLYGLLSGPVVEALEEERLRLVIPGGS
jgi:hypothetical protein